MRAPHATIAGAPPGLWKCGQRQRVGPHSHRLRSSRASSSISWKSQSRRRSMLGTEIAAQSSPVPPSAAHRRHVVHRFLPPFTTQAKIASFRESDSICGGFLAANPVPSSLENPTAWGWHERCCPGGNDRLSTAFHLHRRAAPMGRHRSRPCPSQAQAERRYAFPAGKPVQKNRSRPKKNCFRGILYNLLRGQNNQRSLT